MDLGTIRSFVKVLLHKPDTTAADDTGKPTNATIDAAINDARNELYLEVSTQFPQRFGSATTMTYTSGSDYVQLPSAVRRRPLIGVTAYRTSITADPVALTARAMQSIPSMSTSGWLEHYAVMGENIYLRPIPSTDTTLALNYVAALTELSLTTDTPSEFPSEFHRLLGYLAALKIRMQNQQPMEGLEAVVSEWKQRLQGYMKMQVGDDGIMMVGQAGVFDVATG
jgi:hypothetical protein